jgi:hypothetical protein
MLAWIMAAIGFHQYSTWMIFGGLILMATLIHPSLFSVIMMVLLTCWLFLTREVARAEGVSTPICITCIIGNIALMAFMVFLMFKVNWIAI